MLCVGSLYVVDGSHYLVALSLFAFVFPPSSLPSLVIMWLLMG